MDKEQLNATDVSRELFGGILEADGTGYYPGLELLNFITRIESETILPNLEIVEIRRIAHDFARRLVWDDNFGNNGETGEVFVDEETEDAVKKLLECLEFPSTNRRKKPAWEGAHFFPYCEPLIHWDARRRGSEKNERISLEQRNLRGAGAWAHHVLRTDPNKERLDVIRSGFDAVFKNRDSSLEHLIRGLAAHSAKDETPFAHKIESQAVVRNDQLEELYRDGISNILSHSEISKVGRIKAIVHWTGFWLLTTQYQRAARALESPNPFLIVDCSGNEPLLRRASQRNLKESRALIEKAVDRFLTKKNGALNKKSRKGIALFFTSTAATLKLLNAHQGRRHFILGLEILETLVLAATNETDEMTFETFVDSWLYERCHLVIGRSAAKKSGQIKTMDASIFENNEDYLAIQMEAAGLLTRYSDATRMVNTGGLR